MHGAGIPPQQGTPPPGRKPRVFGWSGKPQRFVVPTEYTEHTELDSGAFKKEIHSAVVILSEGEGSL